MSARNGRGKSNALTSDGESIDPRAFRQCLGQFATGVTVITTRSGGQNVGVTANSFSSLSLDPPLVLWSIGRKSRSFEAFRSAGHFAINILAAGQVDISQRFSSTAEDKFDGVGWEPGITGVPILDGVIGYFECRSEMVHDAGDHILLVGRVLRFARFQGDALLFVQGRYGVVEDHPAAKAAREAVSTAQGSAPLKETRLLHLLFKAYRLTSANFDRHRKAEGMTAAQVRVLSGLYEIPGLTLEPLAKRMYLGSREAGDAVADLVDRGWVTRRPEGGLELTASGRERREAIHRLSNEFDARQLAGVPDVEQASVREFLLKLIDRQTSELQET